MRTISGTFDITMQAEPPFDTRDGMLLGRTRFDKTFHGPLSGTSVVHMTSVRTPTPTSAGYVAIERIEGSLEGRAGSFCALHLGVLDRGAQSLRVTIVPDSGTGALTGISGELRIRQVDGQHHYELDYAVPA
ncbi:MAG: DUF3224 domain-containing protein [Myxococcaceae bacterium]|nr:DUF3224 domain-containing protein [Myxococcaceae bacterium]